MTEQARQPAMPIIRHHSLATVRDRTSSGSVCAVVAIGLLFLYTVVLLSIEWNTSQQVARNYFSDIEGPVRFFAINTTLSVFLLGGAALLFLVCLNTIENKSENRSTWLFYASQVAVFAYLGFDDRFRVHEWIGEKLGTADHYSLLLIGLVECFFLFTLGRNLIQTGKSKGCLLLAAFFFTLMIGVDALGAHDGFMRLSIEDLAKTWGCFFFLLFAWLQLDHAIRSLRITGNAN